MINVNNISYWLDKTKLTQFSKSTLINRYPEHVRVLNYHHVDKIDLSNFAAHIESFLITHQPLSANDFRKVLRGELDLSKPHFVITFDDGFKSHATYVAELLTSLGIEGWFFVPTEVPGLAVKAQETWAVEHRVLAKNTTAMVNGVTFADWDDWEKIKDKHAIASHTHTHIRLSPDVSYEKAVWEIETSYELLEQHLGISSREFCWVGGEFGSYSEDGVRAVRDTMTSLAFTTCSTPIGAQTNPLRIERANLEAYFDLHRVNLALSGLVDLRYIKKRHQLNKYFS